MAEDSLKYLLIFLLLLPKHWDYRHALPQMFYVVLGLNPGLRVEASTAPTELHPQPFIHLYVTAAFNYSDRTLNIAILCTAHEI